MESFKRGFVGGIKICKSIFEWIPNKLVFLCLPDVSSSYNIHASDERDLILPIEIEIDAFKTPVSKSRLISSLLEFQS